MFLVPMLTVCLAKTWRQSSFFFVGLLLIAVGCLGLAFSAVSSELWIAIVAMIVAGSVSAVMTVLRQGGFAMGVALLNAAFTLQTTKLVLPFPPYAGVFLLCAAFAGIGAVTAYMLLKSKENREPD